MANREETKLSMRRFIEAARKAGYSEDIILTAGILAGSAEGHERFGDTKTALDRFYELCLSANNENEFIEQIFDMIEIE